MIRAGVGQSCNADTGHAVGEAVRGALTEAGVDRADAAVVFFTASHAAREGALADSLRRACGTDHVAGCSAAGILTGSGEAEGNDGVAVMVIASDQLRAYPFIIDPLREREAEVGAQIGRDICAGASGESLTVLFLDTYNGHPQSLLQGIKEEAGFSPVVGAGATESGTAQATYQLCAGKIATNAVAGFHFTGAFAAHIDTTQGCQPVSPPMTITKAEKNLIYEIDHRPAIEAFARVIKGPLAEDLRRALMVLFVGLPADRDVNDVAGGNYLVRNIIGLDAQRGVLGVAEEVTDGEAILFVLRDGERARDDLNQMLQRQQNRLAGEKPALGLYFNCCARGTSLYGIPGIDTAYVRQALGDFPLIGMFGGYELAPLGQNNHLFAYTGVLALITAQE